VVRCALDESPANQKAPLTEPGVDPPENGRDGSPSAVNRERARFQVEQELNQSE